MKVTWTATPGAHCKLPGDVRIGAGGKGRYLLVAHMDPLNTFFAPDCVTDPVARIADDPIESLHPCFDERPNQAFCYGRHDCFLLFPSRQLDGRHSRILNPSSEGVKNDRTISAQRTPSLGRQFSSDPHGEPGNRSCLNYINDNQGL